MGDEEDYFPRGGTQKSVAKKNRFVFGPQNSKKDPIKKLGRRERSKRKNSRSGKVKDTVNSGNGSDHEDDFESYAKIAKIDEEDVARSRVRKVQMLSYQNLVEDMVLMCTMNPRINEQLAQVCLPERLLCTVNIDDINLVKSIGSTQRSSNRPKLPKTGDFLVCKIKSRSRKGDKKIHGSTNPYDVNSSLNFGDVLVGSVLLGAVKETEDYGFIVDLGISGVTAFLPFENCEDPATAKKKLCVGQLTMCVVVESKLGETSNKVKLSTKLEDFKSHRVSQADLSARSVMPGMDLSISVTKHLDGDLVVSVDDTDIQGFIPRSQFPTIADDVTKFKVGSKMRGKVLYKYPVSNIVAFTLRPHHLEGMGTIGNGTVFGQAEIVYHDQRGLGVRFEHNGSVCYGLVSRRRMEGHVEADMLEDMFPRGNHLSVVVTGYHHIDQLYSCSTQDDLLAGNLIGTAKLKSMVGQLVTVTVTGKTEEGLNVTWKDHSGLVPLDHVSDVVGAKNVLKNIQLKNIRKGRIFQYNSKTKSLVVTLRPTLVNNTPLVNFTNAVKGNAYWGVVNSTSDTGLTVSFFNDLQAKIDQENLARESRKYAIGELVRCFVVRDKTQKHPPVFSLVRPVDQMVLSVGGTYKLIVKSRNESGVSCLLEENENIINATIPLHHLSDHESLRQKTLDKLNPGTTVDAHLFCFDRKLAPVFTLRESVKRYFEAGGENLLKKGYAALKHKPLMPVILSEEVNDGYFVSVPVPLFNRKILVNKETVRRCVTDGKEGEVIWLAVDKIHDENHTFTLRYPDATIYREQLQKWAIANLCNYLSEVATFQSHKVGDKVVAVGKGSKTRCDLEDGRAGRIVAGKTGKIPEGQRVDLIFVHEDSDKVHLLKTQTEDSPCEDGTYEVVFTCDVFYVGKSPAGYSLCPRFLRPNSSQADFTAETVDGVEVFELRGTTSYTDELTIGYPSVPSLDQTETISPIVGAGTKKNKKKRRRDIIASGSPEKKPKITEVTSNNIEKSPKIAKLKNKKKKKPKNVPQS